jgi:hypothetical protein
MKLKHLFALLILLASIPMSCLQDDSDDEEEDAAGSVAYLNLTYDKSGATTIDFTLPAEPQSWDNITLALSQMADCPVGIFRHPTVSPAVSKYFNRLSPAQRQERFAQFEKQYALQLNGTCASALQRHGLIFDGNLDPTKLLAELRASGSSSLELHVILPKVPYVSITGAPEKKLGELSYLYANELNESKFFSIPVSQSGPAPKLCISFGWSRTAVLRTTLRTLVFCLLPVCILLRARSLSLRNFQQDPTGAWFAFMKTLGWCTNGGMVLWYLTNLGGRRELEQLLDAGVSASPRLSAVINLAVFFLPAALIYLICISISHRVFVDVKRAQYTWAQFLTEHSLTLAQRVLPIACISAAIGLAKNDSRLVA